MNELFRTRQGWRFLYTHQCSIALHDSVLVGVQTPEEPELCLAVCVHLAIDLVDDPLRSIGQHCNRDHSVQSAWSLACIFWSFVGLSQ